MAAQHAVALAAPTTPPHPPPSPLPRCPPASQMAPAQLLPLLTKLQRGLPVTVVALGGSVMADYGGEGGR